MAKRTTLVMPDKTLLIYDKVFERKKMPEAHETIADEFHDFEQIIEAADTMAGMAIFKDNSRTAIDGWIFEIVIDDQSIVFKLPAEMTQERFTAYIKPAVDLFKFINTEEGVVH